MIDKIISGGQTWPEIAALDMAIKLAIPYTGWRPAIQVPSQLVKTDKYRLHTLSSNQPKDAISKNVKESDGTFILSYGKLQEHADYARQMTLKNRKQLLGIDLGQHPPFEAARLLSSWIEMNHIKSLFVTGSTGNKASSIYHQTLRILESALFETLVQSSLPRSTEILSNRDIGIPNRQPATISDAAELLVSFLSLKEKTEIASQKLEVFLQPDTPLGQHIQKIFNLQSGNEILMQSCSDLSGKDAVTPDEASRMIMKALWKKLQKTHRLRIVKRS
jgi:hypothetical protein